VVLVTFDAYAHSFGPPDEEALEAHPLFARGLDYHQAFEVRNSSWIRSLERMNRVQMWHDAAEFTRYRHFIVTFQDATFECIAESFRVSGHTGTPDEVVRLMQR